MRTFRLAPLMALLLASAPHAAGWERWEDFHRDVAAWRLDSTQVASVHSLLIERDACTFALQEGRVALARPLDGRRVAAVFVGRGTMSFTPRSDIERQQLRRFYGTPTLRRPIRSLTLIFADSTLAELRAALGFKTDTLGALSSAWRATQPYLAVRRTKLIWPMPVAHMLVEGTDDGLFWSHATDARTGEPFFFTLDPSSTERVVLERRPDDDRMGLVELFRAEPVCRFFAQGDPDTLRRDGRPSYEATHAGIDVSLTTALDLTATADLDLVANGGPRRWLAFWLPSNLRLDEVSAPGRECRFFQEKDDPLVWVRLEPPLQEGVASTLRMKYHGRCFERDTTDRVHTVRAWCPEPDMESRPTWDVTFHHPRELQVIGAGERVSSEERDGRVHSKWVTRVRVSRTSFDPGFFRGIRVTDSPFPLVVWSERANGGGQVRDLRMEGRDAPGSDERTARDVARALGFYSRAWGAPPVSGFNAVATPGMESAALPGLVHLVSGPDRRAPGARGSPDFFRAHEIARQWWGLGVEPATYHDRWLSEGFSEFSAAWYMQAGRRDPNAYLGLLEDWRTTLLENRRFLLGDGQQAGPIWLGGRTNTSRTPGDYDVVVYQKGAWVLHMLRGYLRGDDDPEETRFRGMLRDFYQRFAGRRAFTEDFRAAVERAAGEDMGWFFAQWVYGTDVPTYRFRWTGQPAEGGAFRIHVRVEQSNVPDTFGMPVALRLNYPDGSFARQRIWVRGPVTELDLPLSPKRPATVVFNDLESVLCEVVK